MGLFASQVQGVITFYSQLYTAPQGKNVVRVCRGTACHVRGGKTILKLVKQRLNIDDTIPIAHNIVNRTIEQAQTRVEGANFDTRKHLLEYDDVLNQQREVFYNQRNRVFTKDQLNEDVSNMVEVEVDRHLQIALEDSNYHSFNKELTLFRNTKNLETEMEYCKNI